MLWVKVSTQRGWCCKRHDDMRVCWWVPYSSSRRSLRSAVCYLEQKSYFLRVATWNWTSFHSFWIFHSSETVWPCKSNPRWAQITLLDSSNDREGTNKRHHVRFATAQHSQASAPGYSHFWATEHVLWWCLKTVCPKKSWERPEQVGIWRQFCTNVE